MSLVETVSWNKRAILPFVVGICLLISTAWLVTLLDERRSAPERAEQLAYLPKGEYLRLAVLGYRQVVADLIWLQAVQHIGARKDTQQGYSWTYHAVDVVTDLDPSFIAVYQAAGLFLGVLVGHHTEALAILEKGMQRNPKAWQLPFFAGYISYYELCDSSAAGRYFRIAAQVPGSPDYLPRLASRMTAVSGQYAAAMEFLERFSRGVSDERLRESLALRMKEVAQERDISVLERSVHLYFSKFQRFPSKPDDLLLSGIIQQLPSDPFGGHYQIDFVTGKVSVSSRQDRLQIPEKVSCSANGRTP